MNKKEIAKLVQPGTWLEVAWSDVPNTIELFLEWDGNIHKDRGDVGLCCYDPQRKIVHRLAVHTQIVKVLGTLRYGYLVDEMSKFDDPNVPHTRR